MKTLLRKTILILAGILFISITRATVITVTVMDYSFTPSSFTANVGDTVKWIWVNGGHTTTSTSVPSGAASWSNPLNSSSTSFEYTITTPGTYNYWCAIHTTMMEASFTVNVTGIPVISDSSEAVAKFFPNPASTVLNVHLFISPNNNNEFIITDILGREVYREPLISINNSIDLLGWEKGIYLYRLKCDRETIEGKFAVQ